MINAAYIRTGIFASVLFPLAVVVNLNTYAVADSQSDSVAQATTPIASVQSNVTLSAALFSPSPDKAGTRIVASVQYIRLSDGRCLSKDGLPQSILDSVSFFSRTVIPNIHYSQANPKDVLRFVCTAQMTPMPDKNQSIGLIYEKRDSALEAKISQAASWVDQLPLDDLTVSCSLQRVNMLEFIAKLSKAMKVDVGFTQDGQIVFGRDGKWSSSGEPSYLLQFSD